MTLRHVSSFLFCPLVVFAFAITPVYADTWEYSFSSTPMLPIASRPVPGLESFGSAVSLRTPTLASQSTARPICSMASAPPALVTEENSVFGDPHRLTGTQSFRRGFTLPPGAFENPVMHITGAPLNPRPVTSEPGTQAPALSSVAPESSSTVLLLGGVFCIIIGVRGKARLGINRHGGD